MSCVLACPSILLVVKIFSSPLKRHAFDCCCGFESVKLRDKMVPMYCDNMSSGNLV